LDGRSGSRRQRRQIATAEAAHSRLRADQFGTERTFARLAFRQCLTLEDACVGFDYERCDDADQWTEKQTQQKEADCIASLGTGNPCAEDGKRQPTDKYTFHVNDLPYGLKDPPGPGGYGSARLASADRALPGEHTR